MQASGLLRCTTLTVGCDSSLYIKARFDQKLTHGNWPLEHIIGSDVPGQQITFPNVLLRMRGYELSPDRKCMMSCCHLVLSTCSNHLRLSQKPNASLDINAISRSRDAVFTLVCRTLDLDICTMYEQEPSLSSVQGRY
jgi:hypothetical protein